MTKGDVIFLNILHLKRYYYKKYFIKLSYLFEKPLIFKNYRIYLINGKKIYHIEAYIDINRGLHLPYKCFLSKEQYIKSIRLEKLKEIKK